jgi:hypothetical protein
MERLLSAEKNPAEAGFPTSHLKQYLAIRRDFAETQVTKKRLHEGAV